MQIEILNKLGEVIAHSDNQDNTHLVYKNTYEEGDQISVSGMEVGRFVMLQLDDAMGESLVYVKEDAFTYPIPMGEKKGRFSPKSFSGEFHLVTARYAREEEVKAYKNVALNLYDYAGATGCYPHAVANVETRGETVFAVQNVINGNCQNISHGLWPYEPWGINRQADAKMEIHFGREVVVDKIRMTTRADFPHDSWWTQVTVGFSDGSTIEWALEKSYEAHELTFPAKKIQWISLGELIKAEDESPFPALTQLEVYGYEA